MTESTWDPDKVPYSFLSTTEEALQALTVLADARKVAIDTETVIDRDENGEIIPRDLDVDGPGAWRVLQIAAQFGDDGPDADIRAWVIDMKDVDASKLAPVLTAAPRPWAWNANFERKVFARDGIKLRRWWDGMLFAAALQQGAYKGTGTRPWYPGLAATVKQYFGVDLEGKDDTRTSYDASTPLTEEQKRYAVADVLWTLKLAGVLADEVAKVDLTDTAVRENNAQGFINGMTVFGLAFDADGYQAEIDMAKEKADDAAERIALATTGREMLDTLVKYAVSAGRVSSTDAEEGKIDAVALLHDPEFFQSFLTAVTRQVDLCREQLGELLDAGPAQEDLFSNTPRVALPFDIDNDVDVRKWVSKNLPQFAAEFMSAHGVVKRNLTKDHELPDVLLALATSEATGVEDQHRQLARVLLSYRRYARIVEQYGSAVGMVRLKPDWNVNSGDQVKAMLNTYAAAEVAAYTAKKAGRARPLAKEDAVDSDALHLMGGDLAKALLDYREHIKTVTTYGEEMLALIHPVTGRIHGRYTQCLVATGRLASFKPNMQNLSPKMKPHSRPKPGPRGPRVLVAADLSQAELRYAAHMSQDENMLDAFRSGVDLHTRTASLMFNADMGELKTSDPQRYKLLRQSAKAPGFGYCYGLSGRALGQQLTVQGIPTDESAGRELLSQFERAYPKLAAYMAARVKFIQGLASAMTDMSRPSGVDFEGTWRLHRLYRPAAHAQAALKAKLGHSPSYAEIAEHISPREEVLAKLEAALGHVPSDEEVATEVARRTEAVAWALGHYGSAVLAEDGTPWSFESRTIGNRRRLFQVGTEDWVLSMALTAARTYKKPAADVRDAWVASYNSRITAEHEAKVAAGKAKGLPKTIALTGPDSRGSGRVVPLKKELLEKAFEDRAVRLDFVGYVLEQMPAAREFLFRAAMADRIKAMTNQFRNHPIQGGVGDAVLEAYAGIEDALQAYPSAQQVQSVHDSIVIECDLQDARAVRDIVVGIMQKCLTMFVPSVPAVADGDIQLSLDAKDALSEEDIDRLLAEQVTAPVALAA